MGTVGNTAHREPWNKGKIVGQEAPFKLNDIWALSVRFQTEHSARELALFNLGIDSKLRGSDLAALKVRDVCFADRVATRAIVLQHKIQRPVQSEITPATRVALQAWIEQAGLKSVARPGLADMPAMPRPQRAGRAGAITAIGCCTTGYCRFALVLVKVKNVDGPALRLMASSLVQQ